MLDFTFLVIPFKFYMRALHFSHQRFRRTVPSWPACCGAGGGRWAGTTELAREEAREETGAHAPRAKYRTLSSLCIRLCWLSFDFLYSDALTSESSLSPAGLSLPGWLIARDGKQLASTASVCQADDAEPGLSPLPCQLSHSAP